MTDETRAPLPETQPLTGDTPRTDKTIAKLNFDGYSDDVHYKRMADFARQLERELRVALNDVAQLKQGYANLQRESALSAIRTTAPQGGNEVETPASRGAPAAAVSTAAPGNGGQQPGTTDSQESPAGERCPVAAPTGQAGTFYDLPHLQRLLADAVPGWLPDVGQVFSRTFTPKEREDLMAVLAAARSTTQRGTDG